MIGQTSLAAARLTTARAAVWSAGFALAWLAWPAPGMGTQAGGDPPISCWRLGSVPGPEDLVVDRSEFGPRLLVSSQDRRTKPQPEGAIYALTLAAQSTAGPRQLRLEGRDECSFHPHGISLVRRETGHWLLYVINHHEPADTSPSRSCLPGGERLARHGQGFTSIEIYRVERNRLRFLQRLAHPEVLRNGNDLVALADGDVFVTAPPSGLLDLALEIAGRAATSEIVQIECGPAQGDDRCSAPSFRPLTTIGRYINGIEARQLADGRRLIYVASTLDDVLQEIKLGEPLGVRAIRVAPGLDNLAWETDGRTALLGAAHPNMRRFLQHSKSPEVPSPSQIWRVSVGASPVARPLLADEGSLISAASSAVCVDGDLVLGQVFESAVLRCRGRCRAETEVTP